MSDMLSYEAVQLKKLLAEEKYAVILCSAVSGDIRTKLTFNQRGINEAASFIIDEMNSRGWNVPKSVMPPKN